RRVAAHVAVPDETADALMHVLISDACRQQAQAGIAGHRRPVHLPMPFPTPALPASAATRLLRMVPPPRRWQPLLRHLPATMHAPLVARMLGSALSRLDPGVLEIIRDRRLGIALDDLGLEWVFAWSDGRLQACHAPPEATVRG